jgi:hypothetical protein
MFVMVSYVMLRCVKSGLVRSRQSRRVRSSRGELGLAKSCRDRSRQSGLVPSSRVVMG